MERTVSLHHAHHDSLPFSRQSNQVVPHPLPCIRTKAPCPRTSVPTTRKKKKQDKTNPTETKRRSNNTPTRQSNQHEGKNFTITDPSSYMDRKDTRDNSVVPSLQPRKPMAIRSMRPRDDPKCTFRRSSTLVLSPTRHQEAREE